MDASVVIREVMPADLDALFELSHQVGYGITHLPRDRIALSKKINQSINSFAKNTDELDNELYLFVMEDTLLKKVIGCCGIITQAGDVEPQYHYKIFQHIFSSETLGIAHKNSFLQLSNDYQGLSELGMLVLNPAYQHLHYGKFLSRVRFLYLADHEKRVTQKIIAQMRGVIDDKGVSPFWEAIGQKFMDMPFLAADEMIASGHSHFVAELLPDAPIALELLPETACEVIGKTHPDTKPALQLLMKEGFTFENYINIFEGGPCIELYLSDNPTIRNSQVLSIAQIENEIQGELYMIATQNKTFRACLAEGVVDNHNIIISTQTARVLNVALGDKVRVSK